MQAVSVPGRAMADTDSDESRRRRDEPPPLEFLRPGETQTPPPATEKPAAWVTRPEDFERPTAARPAPPPTGVRGRSALAGACLVLAGLVGIVSTFVLFVTPATTEEIDALRNWTSEDYLANGIAALFVLYPPPIALIGGITALQRKNWKLAVACALVSLLTFGFLLLGTLLAVLALVLLFSSRREFTS